ncbi:MAG: hypothetical protein LBU32_20775 [Clostridiales bacterium]|nr:hypothetical protein [Clostridiales bacterium]
MLKLNKGSIFYCKEAVGGLGALHAPMIVGMQRRGVRAPRTPRPVSLQIPKALPVRTSRSA